MQTMNVNTDTDNKDLCPTLSQTTIVVTALQAIGDSRINAVFSDVAAVYDRANDFARPGMQKNRRQGCDAQGIQGIDAMVDTQPLFSRRTRGTDTMKTHRTRITRFAAIVIFLLPNAVLALDAAELYVERTCIACHGAEGRVPVMSEYPRIAGQGKDYLLAQMKDIKSGVRKNAHSLAMKNVMHLMNDGEMQAMAEWLAGLPEKQQR